LKVRGEARGVGCQGRVIGTATVFARSTRPRCVMRAYAYGRHRCDAAPPRQNGEPVICRVTPRGSACRNVHQSFSMLRLSCHGSMGGGTVGRVWCGGARRAEGPARYFRRCSAPAQMFLNLLCRAYRKRRSRSAGEPRRAMAHEVMLYRQASAPAGRGARRPRRHEGAVR